ncbi:MAG: hypothetical protein Unbinned4120contig1000_27 [Prokaryotic dsDNA virus sp.]|nr:MAG: hypothetical protein Unbinned4120contig1000_27 [Prokaryotic dsDNA virus sp.]
MAQNTQVHNVLDEALEVIALRVLSRAQQASMVCERLVLGNSATIGVLWRLMLIGDETNSINPTHLGRAVQRKIAREVMENEDHWIRQELFWPRMEHQIRSLAR